MARNKVEKEFLFGLATNEGAVQSLAYFETVAGSWRYVVNHGVVISRINGNDIVDVAKKYFIDENKTIVELVK